MLAQGHSTARKNQSSSPHQKTINGVFCIFLDNEKPVPQETRNWLIYKLHGAFQILSSLVLKRKVSIWQTHQRI